MARTPEWRSPLLALLGLCRHLVGTGCVGTGQTWGRLTIWKVWKGIGKEGVSSSERLWFFGSPLYQVGLDKGRMWSRLIPEKERFNLEVQVDFPEVLLSQFFNPAHFPPTFPPPGQLVMPVSTLPSPRGWIGSFCQLVQTPGATEGRSTCVGIQLLKIFATGRSRRAREGLHQELRAQIWLMEDLGDGSRRLSWHLRPSEGCN